MFGCLAVLALSHCIPVICSAQEEDSNTIRRPCCQCGPEVVEEPVINNNCVRCHIKDVTIHYPNTFLEYLPYTRGGEPFVKSNYYWGNFFVKCHCAYFIMHNCTSRYCSKWLDCDDTMVALVKVSECINNAF